MTKINESPLFDTKAAQYVLGTIMHRPEILYDNDNYILTTDDFQHQFYDLIFSAIYNLAFNGATNINPDSIDLYLSQYPTQYTNYKEKNGLEFLKLVYQLTDTYDEGQFLIYYEKLKKLSILRDFRRNGFDIKEFYNPSILNADEEEDKLNNTKISDILSRIKDKIQLIENKNVSKQESTGQYAARGLRELVATYKETPEVGIPIEGDIINYATRGCRKGKMYLYSAPSGAGKTRTMVGNACSMAFPRIEHNVILKPQELNKVLFIATEMQADEIQTLILAYVSGVPEKNILLGNCTPEQNRLLNIGISIIEEYEENFVIEVVPNPSIAALKAMITNYVIKENVEYVFYDYIFNSPALVDEYKGAGLREDVVLMMLSNSLKEIAANYDIFVMTGTQLNGTWEGKVERTANMIRGSKAIADKIDIGMIGVRCNEELDEIKDYCQQKNVQIPNIVIDIYKNRRGEMCSVKVFRYFDYGTCRAYDIVATTPEYHILNDIPILKIEKDREELSKYE